jgi:hypothetical protein
MIGEGHHSGEAEPSPGAGEGILFLLCRNGRMGILSLLKEDIPDICSALCQPRFENPANAWIVGR